MNKKSIALKKRLKKKYIYISIASIVGIIIVLGIRSLSIKKVTVFVDGNIILKNEGIEIFGEYKVEY